ncbi:MAG: DJ-1/PfpI family protein [Saccharofermentans sp.]|nr:DJ-1/PfpI family protein [Saccharofermentans sp.]
MSKVTVFIADGTEEVECLTTVDILRRANIETQLVSITNSRTTVSSHNVTVVADYTFDEANYDDSDMLFIPGGMPGTTHMSEHEGLAELIKKFASEGKKISAVCAGPSVIGKLGLLDGKKATCFPGWEDKLIGATCTGEGVVTDGIFTTGRGLGFSIDLALELVKILEGQELADDIKGRIQHP